MKAITPLETLNQFFSTRFPNIVLVLGFVVLIYHTISVETRVGNVEHEVKPLDNRVLTVEMKTDHLTEDVKVIKADIKEMRADMQEMRDDIAEIKANMRLLLEK